jgi:hypothetical protein
VVVVISDLRKEASRARAPVRDGGAAKRGVRGAPRTGSDGGADGGGRVERGTPYKQKRSISVETDLSEWS